MAEPAGNGAKTFSKMCSTWADVDAAINEIAASTLEIHQDTIQNTHLLVRFAVDRYSAPDEVCLGYWPTIRLCWKSCRPPFEIEINESQYEFYRFSGDSTQISHVDAALGVGAVGDDIDMFMKPALLSGGDRLDQ